MSDCSPVELIPESSIETRKAHLQKHLKLFLWNTIGPPRKIFKNELLNPMMDLKQKGKTRRNDERIHIMIFFPTTWKYFFFFNEMKCRRRRITSRRLFGNKSGDDGSRSGVTGDTANSCGGGCSPRAIGPRRPLAIVPFQRRLRFLNPLG